jgi:hypothetical protein
MDAFRRSVRLSFTMWGGRYNPIIPVDDGAIAEALVKLFRVDALVRMSDGPVALDFAKAHAHLPDPIFGGGIFGRAMTGGRTPLIVDISHIVTRYYEEFFKNNPAPEPGLDLYEWQVEDPLSDVFLCSYGAFPPAAETGVDYRALVQTSLRGIPNVIQNGAEVQVGNVGRDTINSFNRAFMGRHYAVRNDMDAPGFYVGEADNFDDLINFWNLRAADIPLVFFEPRYADRLAAKAAHWAATIRQAPPPPHRPQVLALWHRTEQAIGDVRRYFGEGVFVPSNVHGPTWNGGNVRAPIMYFGEGAALASIDQSGRTATMSFALTEKPFAADRDAQSQHYVLSVDPGIGLFRNEWATFHTPFIPELNPFYGQNALSVWNTARSEPESLGIVTSVSDDHQAVRAINVNELITAIFNVVGISAAPSKPGLIASTLIRQMGGLDGCRPFKIAGVRTLIERHAPHQSFSRGTAMLTIRGQGEDRPLSDYQWLYIEPREVGSALKNDAVLSYLLEKGVFRAGLSFRCPSCQLEFWRSLDDARSRLECEYCGHGFNAAPQLQDKDWAFRRSGLFGNYDNQEGAIPVLLTLQQLALMHSDDRIFTTAMTLEPKSAAIPKCETDFVLVAERPRDHRIEIIIGEAKTRNRITGDDVAKLKAVADAFPKDRYDVYVVFSRLTPFSDEEVEHIRHVNGPHDRRAIMFTDRELEPYFTYERTAKEFDIRETAVSFADMAIATARVFFEQRRHHLSSTDQPQPDA